VITRRQLLGGAVAPAAAPPSSCRRVITGPAGSVGVDMTAG